MAVDLNLFRVFQALMLERSVTAAARRLGLGQPAVSASLARLRALFEDPLFERSRYGVIPTERAEEVAPIVDGALSQLETVAAVHQTFEPSRSRRTFRLLASEYAEAALVPPLAGLVATRAPEIRLHVIPLGATLDPEILRSGRADLALGRFDSPDKDLVVTELMQDELVCLLPRGKRSIRRLSLARYQSMRHVIVTPQRKLRTGVFQLLEQHGIVRQVRAQVTSFHHAAQIVARAGYCATFPSRIAAGFESDPRLTVVAAPLTLPPFPTHVAWHPRHRRDAGHAWLRKLLPLSVPALDPKSAR
jgi:DNA-binding transcriptional LysR family regulator